MVVFDFFGFVAVGGGPAGRADGGPAARSVEGGCVGPLRDVRGSAGLVLLAGQVLDVLDGEVGEIFVGVKEELGFSAELHEIFEHIKNNFRFGIRMDRLLNLSDV